MIEKDNYKIFLYKRRIDLTPELGHVATSSSVRSKNLDIFKSNYLNDFPEYIKYKSFNLNRYLLEFSIENFSDRFTTWIISGPTFCCGIFNFDF